MKIALLFLVAMPAVFADPPIDISHLTYDEKLQFQKCHSSFFWDQSCQAILGKACESDKNSSLWDCIDKQFSDCRESDFGAPGCAEKLAYVCDRTEDGYDFFCNRYRYEDCLSKFFAGDKCSETRRSYTLPILKNTIEDIRKNSATGIEGLGEWFCSLAGGDKGNPLYGYCEERIGMMDFETFEKSYRQYAQATSDEARDSLRTKAFQRLLLGVGPTNYFDKIAATFYWVLESERDAFPKYDKQLKEYAAEVLARFGDDGLVATFLLIEAAHHENPAIRKMAILGLGNRNYPSDLAMLVLVRALNAVTKIERIAAMESIGKRWLAAAAATNIGRIANGQLGSLLNCHDYPPDSGFFSDLNDVNVIGKIDFTQPKYLCNTGSAGRLIRLNAQVMALLKEKAKDFRLEQDERAMAIFAVSQMALISPDSIAEARKFFIEMLSDVNSSELDVDITVSLSSISNCRDSETYQFMFDLIKKTMLKQLSAFTGKSRSNVTRLLMEAARHKMIHPVFDQNADESINLTNIIIDSCVKGSEVPFEIAMDCMSALNESDASLGVLEFAEELAWSKTNQGSFQSREFAVELYSAGLFNGPSLMNAEDAEFTCKRRAHYLQNLIGLAKNIVMNDAQRTPLLSGISKAISTVVTSVDETSCDQMESAKLAAINQLREKDFLAKLTRILERAMPKLPMKSWYGAFTKEHPNDVVKVYRIENLPAGVKAFRNYQTREDLKEHITKVLENITKEDELYVLYAWDDVQKLFALATSQDWKNFSVADEATGKELWGY